MKLIKKLSPKLATAIIAMSASLGAQAVVIQAEDYNAFFDTTPGNTGGAYRGDDVDVEATSDAGGGHNVGWIESGEWLAYNNINFPTTGTYTIKLRVASGSGGGNISIDLNGGSTVLGSVNVPNTGGWQNWQTVSFEAFVNAGTHGVGMFASAGGFNLNHIEIVANNSGGGGGGGSAATVYQHCNYTGWAANLGEGRYNLAALHSLGFVNDDASSIRVSSGYEAVLYQHDNFTGSSTVVGSDNSCLVSKNFNDAASSVVIRRAGGGGGGGNLPVSYPGYTGNYPGFSLVYDDRFDNFNQDVWAKGDGAVGGESICRFQPQGVEVRDGKLQLTIREQYVPGSWSNDHNQQKGNYNYSCGEMRTKPSKRIKYGRIETRMKAPSRSVASGYISSLFTYTHEGSPREWQEIDVELEGGRPDKFQANLIYGKNAADWSQTRNWGAWEHKIDTGPVDQWRVFAIEWTPSAIKWYVDGTLVKTLDQDWIDCSPNCVYPQIYYTPIPNKPTEVMMNFWIPNDGIQDAFGGNKWANRYPMVTEYDWIRIYELNSHPLTNW